jgi:hypothetical protein
MDGVILRLQSPPFFSMGEREGVITEINIGIIQ